MACNDRTAADRLPTSAPLREAGTTQPAQSDAQVRSDGGTPDRPAAAPPAAPGVRDAGRTDAALLDEITPLEAGPDGSTAADAGRATGATPFDAGSTFDAAADAGGPAPRPSDAAPSVSSGDGGHAPGDASSARDAGASKVAFVTSTSHDGALGGVEGADAICSERALAADLPGTFRAWLSSPGQELSSRLSPTSLPYVRTDGVRVADDFADLLDASLSAPLDRDEFGLPASGDTWTGTRADGSPHPEDSCLGFTASAGHVGSCGNAGSVDFRWTENLVPACTTRLRLYCFEQ